MFRSMVAHIYPPFIFLMWASFFYFTSKLVFHFKKQTLYPMRDDPGVRQVFTLIGSLFSFFLGFVVFIVWSGYEKSNQIVVDETTKLYVFWESSRVFPSPVDQRLQTALTHYVASILNDEWPAMNEGKESPQTHIARNALYSMLKAYQPKGSFLQAYYSTAINALNTAIEFRNQRLSRLHVVMPPPWYFLIMLGALTIVVISLFLLEQIQIAHFVHLTLCFFLAFYLTAIFVLSYPFSGIVAVSNEPYSRLLLMFSNASNFDYR